MMSAPVKLAIVSIAALLLGAVALDSFVYNFDISSCLSDNLSTVHGAIEEYSKEHGGKTPESVEELSAFWDSEREHGF